LRPTGVRLGIMVGPATYSKCNHTPVNRPVLSCLEGRKQIRLTTMYAILVVLEDIDMSMTAGITLYGADE
jgi:hypothetical protein